MNAGTCMRAAIGGHLHVLQWLRREGCEWDSKTCGGASFGGYLEILKWARSQGCPIDETTCNAAGEGGHLDILKYLRTEGCPWGRAEHTLKHTLSPFLLTLSLSLFFFFTVVMKDESCCHGAAHAGHLEVLEWARSQGAPWDAARIAGMSLGHHDVTEWLRGQPGVPVIHFSIGFVLTSRGIAPM